MHISLVVLVGQHRLSVVENDFYHCHSTDTQTKTQLPLQLELDQNNKNYCNCNSLKKILQNREQILFIKQLIITKH